MLERVIDIHLVRERLSPLRVLSFSSVTAASLFFNGVYNGRLVRAIHVTLSSDDIHLHTQVRHELQPGARSMSGPENPEASPIMRSTYRALLYKVPPLHVSVQLSSTILLLYDIAMVLLSTLGITGWDCMRDTPSHIACALAIPFAALIPHGAEMKRS